MAAVQHVPVRRCVACGQRLPKKELTRIVRTTEGRVTVDPTGKKAGRGAYLCSKQECWTLGLKKGRLDHSLRFQLVEQDREEILAHYQKELKATSIGALG